MQYSPHFMNAETEAFRISDLPKVTQVFSDGSEAGQVELQSSPLDHAASATRIALYTKELMSFAR